MVPRSGLLLGSLGLLLFSAVSYAVLKMRPGWMLPGGWGNSLHHTLFDSPLGLPGLPFFLGCGLMVVGWLLAVGDRRADT